MHIARGVTRTVLVTKNYAIKVPRFYKCKGHRVWTFVRAWAANISERDWSDYEEAEGQICPVINSYLGGLINVYPRAEVCTDDDVVDMLWPHMTFKTPSDRKATNFGWYKGKFVWLDYDMNWNDCGHEVPKNSTPAMVARRNARRQASD
jgi:hypothetical protein